ncbi:thiol:disulfide interchange protein DsbG [Cupriavidus consociatus]|uniref:thiol:disulfide interchange protein DsbG n=1 Tax=Cupriavidus consociatus TaxID=2821357 RepID=UPI001AE7DDA6|nr:MULTISPECIES: thiol:disulfide interchange protein DsbG [unclassified Cupriavidus]MBP0623340.1 thiol:disulfide interchange protein DsbG [Cupriavidus sp. LEh25]MDK2660037.1 thiol:disulfide interchange protein DsbG [Cupriavidus sp. LEh21]
MSNTNVRSGTLARVAQISIAAVALAICLPPAYSAAAGRSDYPEAIEAALKSGVKVIKTFPAVSGLTGWALEKDGQQSIVYTTSDNQTLLVGNLVGEGGENISARYEQQFLPKPDFSSTFAEVEKSSYVVEGTVKAPKRILYVFTDAECPYCHLAWKALQPYEAAGLQVRWVLVAVIKPSSLPKAIEILAADDRTGTFRALEQSQGKPWRPSHGIDDRTRQSIVANLQRNQALMERLQFGGTPGFVWKDEKGEIRRQPGLPRLAELPSITGLPKQQHNDPELTRLQ